MCRIIPLGIAMTAEVMDKMKAGERRFWEKFLSRAKKEIDSADSSQFPLKPSNILQRRYQKALKKYNGEIYCQVRQLQYYFKFSCESDPGA